MKTVLLMRHAKSDWGDESLADFDRPLNKRGMKDAPLMGGLLRKFDYVPDRILASPAKRAKQTTKMVAKACDFDPEQITWDESFYHGDSDNLVAAIERLPDEVNRVMLVGHNPIMEDTAADLLSANSNLYHGVSVQMPTSALMCLELNITTWAKLQTNRASLRWLLIPKLMRMIA